MNRQITTALLSLLGVFSYAQAVTCKKGIQCGNTCISASYTCHVGGPTATPVVQTLTSPPLPTEPYRTYFGWSALDNSSALLVLNNRTTPVPISIGYTKQISGLTPQAARERIQQVLKDEIFTGDVVLERQVGTSYHWLIHINDFSKGVLISLDPQPAGITLQVSVFSASSAFDHPGFTTTARNAFLRRVGPAGSPTRVVPIETTPILPAATAPVTSPLKLFSNPDNVFLSPATGNLIAPVTCKPFSFSVRPDQAFSQVTLTQEGSNDLSYSLDVSVDGQTRFTQPDVLTGGPTVLVPLGQQPAGAVVNFSYKPHDPSIACEGVLSIGLKVEP